ncbi:MULTISPECIES: hypothetical protein [unclassified Pseudomonas]|uniref:hypothetical protein n=1 Tax=unclassified Pseudomonas TaxID=196821 RepID=UPI001CBCA69C|nr:MULTISPECIES: hypothetical protein [unclassified Pseudomonas]
MKVYENVVIGNFLYSLGFSVRSHLNKNTPFPSVVNLLQQTPVDKELGDVLLTFPGLVRLIEFKMKGASLKKEKRRHQLLSLALERENAMLVETSKSVHWYVELSAKSDTAPLISRVVPYLDAFTDSESLRPGGIEEMVDQTARQAVSETDPLSREQARAYLDLVRLTLGKEKPVGAGGLLLVMDAQGGMHFAQVQDLVDLNLPDGLWLERMLAGPEMGPLDLSVNREKAGPTLKHEPTHEISFHMR